MNKNEILEETRLHAEDRMPPDWDRKSEIEVGVFYKYFIDYLYDKLSHQWISVKDRPLIIETPKGWECTEDGNKDFLAAIPYWNISGEKVLKWAIHHCCFEDEVGLCVVGDDENTPCGWDHSAITHYIPIPAPPQNI